MTTLSLPPIVAAGVVTDSLGREWDPRKHPRGRDGRFIHTFKRIRAFISAMDSDPWMTGEVTKINEDGSIRVRIKNTTDPNLVDPASGKSYAGNEVDITPDLVESINEKAVLDKDSKDAAPSAFAEKGWGGENSTWKSYFERFSFGQLGSKLNNETILNTYFKHINSGQDPNEFSEKLRELGENSVIADFAAKQTAYVAGLRLRYEHLKNDNTWDGNEKFRRALAEMGVPEEVIDDTPDGMSGVQWLADQATKARYGDKDPAYYDVVPLSDDVVREQRSSKSGKRMLFRGDIHGAGPADLSVADANQTDEEAQSQPNYEQARAYLDTPDADADVAPDTGETSPASPTPKKVAAPDPVLDEPDEFEEPADVEPTPEDLAEPVDDVEQFTDVDTTDVRELGQEIGTSGDSEYGDAYSSSIIGIANGVEEGSYTVEEARSELRSLAGEIDDEADDFDSPNLKKFAKNLRAAADNLGVSQKADLTPEADTQEEPEEVVDDDWTDEQIEVLDEYVSASQDINDTLRDIDDGVELGGGLKQYVDTMDGVIGSYELTEDTTVYRGLNAAEDAFDFDGFVASLIPGTTIREKAYMSTSLNPDVAENFTKTEDNDTPGVFMEISAPAGMAALPMDAVPIDMMGMKEEELLFPRNSRIYVESRDVDENGVTRIRARLLAADEPDPTPEEVVDVPVGADESPAPSVWDEEPDYGPLTAEQAKHFQNYMGTGARKLNKILRDNESGDLADIPEDAYFDNTNVHEMTTVLDELVESQLEVGTYKALYRGMVVDPATDQDFLDSLVPGAKIRDKGFMSTSTSPDVADSFASSQYADRVTVNFSLSVSEGMRAINVDSLASQIPGAYVMGENEFLFGRNVQTLIEDVQLDSNGNYTVLAKLLPPGDNDDSGIPGADTDSSQDSAPGDAPEADAPDGGAEQDGPSDVDAGPGGSDSSQEVDPPEDPVDSLDQALEASDGGQKFEILDDPGESGDGYYPSTDGSHFWGKYGAAGVLVRNVDENGVERFLMVQRGPIVSTNKGKWQLPGGALNSNENDYQGTARELNEELQSPDGWLDSLSPAGEVKFEHPSGWHYTNIAADSDEMFDPTVDGSETSDAKWFTRDEIAQLPLHPALEKSLPEIFSKYIDPDTLPGWNDDETVGEPDEVDPELLDAQNNHGQGPTLGQIIDAMDWEQTGGQGGSNQGGMFQDENGQEWYVKLGKTEEHAKNEALAAAFYKEAGIPTADLQLANTPYGGGALGTASPRIPGAKNDLKQMLEDSTYKGELAQGFAVDAWLANWDVAGLVYDNIVTDENGVGVRIDPGGALIYRAQGAPKGGAFGGSVGELQTFKDKSNTASRIFDDMTLEDEILSAQKVLDISPDRIDELVDAFDFNPDTAEKLKTTLKLRRADIAGYYDLDLPEMSNTEPPTQEDDSNVPDVPGDDDEDMWEVPSVSPTAAEWEKALLEEPLAEWEKELLGYYDNDDDVTVEDSGSITGGEPGPDSEDWENMVDDKGAYRWDKDGNKIRVGDKVIGADGVEMTISKFENNNKGVIALDAENKKRIRHRKKLSLVLPAGAPEEETVTTDPIPAPGPIDTPEPEVSTPGDVHPIGTQIDSFPWDGSSVGFADAFQGFVNSAADGNVGPNDYFYAGTGYSVTFNKEEQEYSLWWNSGLGGGDSYEYIDGYAASSNFPIHDDIADQIQETITAREELWQKEADAADENQKKLGDVEWDNDTEVASMLDDAKIVAKAGWPAGSYVDLGEGYELRYDTVDGVFEVHHAETGEILMPPVGTPESDSSDMASGIVDMIDKHLTPASTKAQPLVVNVNNEDDFDTAIASMIESIDNAEYSDDEKIFYNGYEVSFNRTSGELELKISGTDDIIAKMDSAADFDELTNHFAAAMYNAEAADAIADVDNDVPPPPSGKMHVFSTWENDPETFAYDFAGFENDILDGNAEPGDYFDAGDNYVVTNDAMNDQWALWNLDKNTDEPLATYPKTTQAAATIQSAIKLFEVGSAGPTAPAYDWKSELGKVNDIPKNIPGVKNLFPDQQVTEYKAKQYRNAGYALDDASKFEVDSPQWNLAVNKAIFNLTAAGDIGKSKLAEVTKWRTDALNFHHGGSVGGTQVSDVSFPSNYAPVTEMLDISDVKSVYQSYIPGLKTATMYAVISKNGGVWYHYPDGTVAKIPSTSEELLKNSGAWAPFGSVSDDPEPNVPPAPKPGPDLSKPHKMDQNGNPMFIGDKVFWTTKGIEVVVHKFENNDVGVIVVSTAPDGTKKKHALNRKKLKTLAHAEGHVPEPNKAGPPPIKNGGAVQSKGSPPDPDSPWFGVVAPTAPVLDNSLNLTGQKLVDNAWLDAADANYKKRMKEKNPGWVEKNLYSSNTYHMYLAAQKGDKAQLESLLSLGRITKELYDDALNQITTKNKAYEEAYEKYKVDLKKWREDTKAWRLANGIPTIQLKGMDEGTLKLGNTEAKAWMYANNVAGDLNPSGKLSSAAYTAVDAQKGSNISPTLRAGKEKTLDPEWLAKNASTYVLGMDQAMTETSGLKHDFNVLRTFSPGSFTNPDTGQPYNEGDNMSNIVGSIQHDWGFAETSVGSFEAGATTTWGSHRSVEMELRVPAGMKSIYTLGPNMHFGLEHERGLILERGIAYYIHKVEKVNGKWRIWAEIISKTDVDYDEFGHFINENPFFD